MQVFNLEIFDDILVGTGVTWYTPSEHEELLGLASELAVQASVTNVGAGTILTVASMHSSDGENWIDTGANEVNGLTITEGASYYNYAPPFGGVPLGARVRYRISLGGAGAQCRLKLHVTGRDHGA